MKRFYETLPLCTERAQRLLRQIRAADQSQLHRQVLNLLDDRDYANASFMLRRGMYVKRLLESLPLLIFPDELVIGSVLGIMPRVISETYEERKKWADMSLAFPARNTVWGTQDYTAENRPLVEQELHDDQRGRWSWGHSCYGLEKILKRGYLGIAEDAEQKATAMRRNGEIEQDKLDFWDAVSMSCRAVADFSYRYADELERMARKETDPGRRLELEQAAADTRCSPAHPAQSFRQAIQGTWFSFQCNFLFNGTDLGRFDQYVYPYYVQDLSAGKITVEEAQELLDCLWVKFNEWAVWHTGLRGFGPSIMLGGVDKSGHDATNDITYMCLTATQHLCVPTPKLSVRINEETPEDIYELAHSMLTGGLMMPDFYNEKSIIHAYEQIGVPFEDAITFSQSVCEELSLAGISEECTNEGPHIDLHDMVMAALRACSEKKASFDDLLDRVDAEISKKIASEVDYHNRQTAKLAYYLPQPLHSATIEGCVESGRDIMSGGAKYNNTGSVISGVASAANSLYSIKRLIYDEKRLTIQQLLDILAADYREHEELRAEILSKFPKYGNDESEVDQYAVRMYNCYCQELRKYRNSRNGVFKTGAWASEFRSNYPATPDGRKRWDSFAPNISPTPGTDQKGATAVIRSATRLGLRCCAAGGMVDVTVSPSCFKTENGKDLLRSLVKAYCALDGAGLQFNFIDSTMLQNAMADPVKYKNLMVRVWGYNDYYVSLPKDMQKNILDRTRHEEGL